MYLTLFLVSEYYNESSVIGPYIDLMPKSFTFPHIQFFTADDVKLVKGSEIYQHIITNQYEVSTNGLVVRF